MNEFKKNWLGWIITLAIALTVQYYVFSKSISYQNSQKTQDELIRLDKEKVSKADFNKEEQARIAGDESMRKEVTNAIERIRQTIDDKNDKQTDRIIEVLNKRNLK